MKKVFLLCCCLITLCAVFSFQSCNEDESNEENLLLFPSLEVLLKDNTIVPLISHRGCWSGDSIPQNSLAAFRKALQLPILGTEFDVHQTIDGHLVINHDTQFDSLYIYKTSYSDLCNHHLPNGETIPLLEDFVKEFCSARVDMLMIIDLKSGNVGDVINVLKQYDVLSRVLFVCFSKKYCDELVRRGYGPITYYLGGDLAPEEVGQKGYGGINYSHTILKEHPEWIDEAKILGLGVGVWTVNNSALIEEYLSKGLFVTTDAVDSFLLSAAK